MKKWLLILSLIFGCTKQSIKSERDRTSPEEAARQLGGLGIYISMVEEIPTIKSVIEGMPAYEEKIQSGDKIIKIEGESTKGMKIEDTIWKLRGMPETKVTITIQREGLKNPFDCTLTRTIIKIPVISEEAKTDTLEERVPSTIDSVPKSPPSMKRKKQVYMKADAKMRKALIRESIVLPEYPDWAREKTVSPVVIRLKLFVASSGDIRTVITERSSGLPQLDKSVAATVKKWKCEPTMERWDGWIEFLFMPER